MHVMPTCHFDDAGRRRLALLNDPTIVAVAPDPTESKPCSRLLICLQINQQTIAGKVAARKAVFTGGLLLNERRYRIIRWLVTGLAAINAANSRLASL